MSNINTFFKKNYFLLSLILCFILPPVGMILLFTISLLSLYRHRNRQKNGYYTLGSFFFLCLFIASIGASVELKDNTYFVTCILILGYWGLYLKISTENSLSIFKQYRFILILGGIYSCLIGWTTKFLIISPVVGFMTGTLLFGEPTPEHYPRLIGIAYNPNFNMYLLLFSLAFLLAEVLNIFRTKRFSFLFWQIPGLLILTKGIFDTGSRAGFVAMVCVYLLFFIRLNRVSFMIVSILSIIQLKTLLKIMPREEFVNNSMDLRMEVWKNSIKLWEQHPYFGTTPLGFGKEFTNYLHQSYVTIPSSLMNIPHAHDIFLGFFAEYGTLGGVAFIILLFIHLIKFILFFFKETNAKYGDYFMLGLPVIILTGFFDEPIFSPQMALLTIIMFAYWEYYAKRISIIQPVITFVITKIALPFFEFIRLSHDGRYSSTNYKK